MRTSCLDNYYLLVYSLWGHLSFAVLWSLWLNEVQQFFAVAFLYMITNSCRSFTFSHWPNLAVKCVLFHLWHWLPKYHNDGCESFKWFIKLLIYLIPCIERYTIFFGHHPAEGFQWGILASGSWRNALERMLKDKSFRRERGRERTTLLKL